MKITPTKVFMKIMQAVARNTIIDRVLLCLNDYNNRFLKRRLQNSFKKREILYGEGGIRLSNDPDIQVYYGWQRQGRIFWAQNASFAIMALLRFDNKRVLELGCANGWYYREFYSWLTDISYVGCDLSKDTIEEANRKLKYKERKLKKKYDASFVVADILEDIPFDDYTNILWFASMCMFTKEQRKVIFTKISQMLDRRRGILSGSVTLKDDSIEQWKYYIGLIDSKATLEDELSAFFSNIYITNNTGKNSLFFMASNGPLPCYNKTERDIDL